MRNNAYKTIALILFLLLLLLLLGATVGCASLQSIVGGWQDNRSEDTWGFTSGGNVIRMSDGRISSMSTAEIDRNESVRESMLMFYYGCRLD